MVPISWAHVSFEFSRNLWPITARLLNARLFDSLRPAPWPCHPPRRPRSGRVGLSDHRGASWATPHAWATPAASAPGARAAAASATARHPAAGHAPLPARPWPHPCTCPAPGSTAPAPASWRWAVEHAAESSGHPAKRACDSKLARCPASPAQDRPESRSPAAFSPPEGNIHGFASLEPSFVSSFSAARYCFSELLLSNKIAWNTSKSMSKHWLAHPHVIKCHRKALKHLVKDLYYNI